MQTRLRSNLEAIGMLNQQVRARAQAHMCRHTTCPDSPFTRQIQTHTHTPAHLLLSSHRRGSFHASNFKHTRALTHRRTQTSISSSYDKSEKEAARWGCVWCGEWVVVVVGGGEGDKLYREKAVTFFSTGKWFPFHETERGMYINTAVLISPWQRREMARCDKTMWGEKHRGIFWGKADIFYCVELHKSQQITKGEKNQKYSSAPSVLQNSRAWGTAHLTFVSLWNGLLIDGVRRKLILEVLI